MDAAVPASRSAAARSGMPPWARVLVAVVADLALLGLAWAVRGKAPSQLISGPSTLAVVVGLVVVTTVTLAGHGRWPLVLHGVLWLVGGTAFALFPQAAALGYRALAAEPVAATVVSADTAANRQSVRLADGDVREGFRTGGGPAGEGDATTVYVDPAGLLPPDTDDGGLDAAVAVVVGAGVGSALVWQIAVLGVVFRKRDDSMLARWGTSDDAAQRGR